VPYAPEQTRPRTRSAGLRANRLPSRAHRDLGATGDLARRKLVRRSTTGVSGHLARRSGSWACQSEHSADEFARDMREAWERSRGPSDRPGDLAGLRGRDALSVRLLRRAGTYARLRAQLEELDRTVHPRQPPTTSPRRQAFPRSSGPQNAADQPAQTTAVHARVIENPSARLASARALNDWCWRPRRAPGLPHRPLPGKRDRPEPLGLPVCELHLRAHLNPARRITSGPPSEELRMRGGRYYEEPASCAT